MKSVKFVAESPNATSVAENPKEQPVYEQDLSSFPAPRLIAFRLGLVCTLGLAACPSFVNLQTAHALDKGQFEVTQAASIIGATDNGTSAKGAGSQPTIYFAGRYGVAEGLDVGFKFEPVAGFIGTATIQLLRSHYVELALTPDVGYFTIPAPVVLGTNLSVEEQSLRPNYSIVPVELPLLIGINFGHENQLVIGPRISAFVTLPEAIYQPGSLSDSNTSGGVELFAGGGVGFSVKAGDRLRVMPELDVTKPIAWTGANNASCGTGSCAPYPTAGVIYQASIGIAIGMFGGPGFW